MKNYIGWLRKDVFSGEEYERRLSEMERAVYDFIIDHRDVLDEDGWIRYRNQKYFTGDHLYTWSRQYEYLYAAANIDPEDRNLLDIGSGFNFLAFWLQKRGHDVTCSDLNDLGHLFRGKSVQFIQDDITDTAIREQYDCVYCISVLEHIPRKDKAVENILKLLKPGGKLVLTLDCALDRKPGDTPSIEQVYLLVDKINREFGYKPDGIHFERNEQLITTESFYRDEAWRLPWKEPSDGPAQALRRWIRRTLWDPKRSLAVFLGTWTKGEDSR